MADEAQTELNKRLVDACKTGVAAEVITLLDKGADINYSKSESEKNLPLVYAAYCGHLEVVNILLVRGADRQGQCNKKTAAQWAQDTGHTAVAVRLSEDPDQVIFQQPLSDRTLEEVFNFATLERISLVRHSPQGAVEAITREPFSEIVDQSQLRKAFEEHVRRGGKADESRVFPYVLSKSKSPRSGL
ncbi:MAG: ankyrin repeat domain-containing protein [Proteobacteria bacterium]|nr:ankyrin repeat domain-containing protein [Pseudomonadota bacterium]